MSQFEHYVRSGNKNLRMGYTTGTCASLAAGAAARYALTGEVPAEISVMTVKGIPVTLEPHASRQGLIVGTGDGTAFDTDGDEKTFSVSVIKDAGDDADATNGIEVWASVTLTEVPGIEIDGGFGVGRVTKPGLDQPVGNAAINSTPRRMIRQMVEEAIEEAEYVIELLEDHEIDGPVAYDWEMHDSSYRVFGTSQKMATACAIAFCERIAREGYTPMIYASGYVNYMKYDQGAIADYLSWYPEYKSEESEKLYPDFIYQMDYWQFSSKCTVDGIGGYVDGNLHFY
jgi:hypothetical protein